MLALEYNERRLHAGLGYLRPTDFYRGDLAARWRDRAEKLARARAERRRLNDARLAAVA